MSVSIEERKCVICGIPVDAEFFDVSGFVGEIAEKKSGPDFLPEDTRQNFALPQRGEQKVLATFQLHPQYCGVITRFAQYTDQYARDNSQIHTPGFEWLIFQNGKPVFPYTQLEMIINPWGYNCFPVSIRLDENARVEFVLRNRSVTDLENYPIQAFAGRIVGQYWYNEVFGRRIR